MPLKDREARAAYNREYGRTHRDQILDKKRIYNAEHRERQAAYHAAYYRTHRDEMRASQRLIHLKTKYGLAPGQYEAMVAAQNGLCAICGREKTLVVDHSHASGRVRKLLCHGCNTLLAGIEDLVWRAKAEAYLAE